jgi:hypothetical protein
MITDNPHHSRRWTILAILAIAQLMVVLDLCAVGGEGGALARRDAKVGRARVGDDLARVVARGQSLTDELLDAELVGSCDPHGAVQRRADSDPAGRVRSRRRRRRWVG